MHFDSLSPHHAPMDGGLPGQASPLSLTDFGVRFGERVILQGITLEMVGRCLCIMGHAGAGKSTLLRTLSGLNDAQPELLLQGTALIFGEPLATSQRPWLVGQNARLLLATVVENVADALTGRERLSVMDQRSIVGGLLKEALGEDAPPLDARVVELSASIQRSLAIVRGVAAGAPLLMLDEPTAGLPPEGQKRILEQLLREKSRRHILLVTHRQSDARAIGDEVALFVNGRMVEMGSTEPFFSAPQSLAAQRFVKTGTCYFEGESPTDEPPPVAVAAGEPVQDKDSSTAEEAPAPAYNEAPVLKSPTHQQPKYFHWVVPGALVGMARPGLVRDLDEDLCTLRQMGVKEVFCLEETRTVPDDALSRYGLQGTHIPIVDMGVPNVQTAVETCSSIARHVREGRPVAVHCLGGAGRTGLLLAAYLIYLDQSAKDALASIRQIHPRFVQSEAQVEFLSLFEQQCRGAGLRQNSSSNPIRDGGSHGSR